MNKNTILSTGTTRKYIILRDWVYSKVPDRHPLPTSLLPPLPFIKLIEKEKSCPTLVILKVHRREPRCGE